jgi:hypothetical protein
LIRDVYERYNDPCNFVSIKWDKVEEFFKYEDFDLLLEIDNRFKYLENFFQKLGEHNLF